MRECTEVLAVNDAYRLCPDADYLYSADQKWWAHHIGDVIDGFDGALYTQAQGWDKHDPKHWGLTVWNSKARPGLSREPGLLHKGDRGNSGYQALNLAFLLGAERILLLGFDMANWGGRAHWFGEHPVGLNRCKDYQRYIPGFRTICPEEYGVEIINCTRRTALDAFPVQGLGETLQCLSADDEPVRVVDGGAHIP